MAPVTKITKGSRKKPRIEKIQADKIRVDEQVQRALIPARRKAIAEKLDLDGLGVITVSERDNGEMVVLDGQHRLAALDYHDMGEWEVDCHIYRGLTVAQEAALFRRLNDTRKITPFDDFSKALTEGDAQSLALNEIIQQHGLRVTASGGDGQVTCITKLRQLYVSNNGVADGATLDEVLGVVLDAWGLHYPAVEKSILGGAAIVLSTYGKELDHATLVEKLAKVKGGPSGLLGQARLFRDFRTAPMDRLVASVIVQVYNKGRTTRKLAEL